MRIHEDKNLRFTRVHYKGKNPVDLFWNKYNNYSYNDQKLQKHLKDGGNIGLCTGFGNLLVVDFDEKEFQDKFFPLLPETLTQRSGSGGLHLFYYADECPSFKIFDKNKKTLADIQGEGTQIIIEPSTHPNGNKYKFINDKPIASLKIADLKRLFKDYLPRKYAAKNGFHDEIKKPRLSSVLSQNGVDTSKNPTACPWHSSKGGKCFSFDDNKGLFHCFHCDKSGDVIKFIEEHKNCDFKEACKELDIDLTPKKKATPILNGFEVRNTTENVEYFHENCTPFFYDKNCLFWFWNSETFKYELVDDIDIMNNLDLHLNFKGYTVNKSIKAEYIEAFKRVGRLKHPKEAPAKWIQFRDKAFSITKKKIYDVQPNYFFTNPIPWDIGETEETPMMDKLITDWVGKKYLKTIYEIIAYSCYSDYPIHRIFCFMGSGRNGKSQLQRMLRIFLGEDNCSDADLDDLMENRFAAWSLYKKLICSMGETNFGTMRRTQKIKKLSGQDPVTFEKKNVQSFDGYNYAKLIVNTNSLPSTADTSDGFYRRWMIINFPNEFKEGRDIIREIPDIEYNNLAKKVCRLLPELLEKGEFDNEGSIEERRKNFEMNSNPLPYFVEKYCEITDDGYDEQGHIYSEYCKFLHKQKMRRVTNQEFISSLSDLGFWVNRTSKRVGKDEEGMNLYKSARWVERLKVKYNNVYQSLNQNFITDEKIDELLNMEIVKNE